MGEPGSNLEPVIVSASRLPELLRSAPIGATVITAEQISRAGVIDASEAVRKLGGLPSRSDLMGGEIPRSTCVATATAAIRTLW